MRFERAQLLEAKCFEVREREAGRARERKAQCFIDEIFYFFSVRFEVYGSDAKHCEMNERLAKRNKRGSPWFVRAGNYIRVRPKLTNPLLFQKKKFFLPYSFYFPDNKFHNNHVQYISYSTYH